MLPVIGPKRRIYRAVVGRCALPLATAFQEGLVADWDSSRRNSARAEKMDGSLLHILPQLRGSEDASQPHCTPSSLSCGGGVLRLYLALN